MKFSIAGGEPRYKSLQYSMLCFISSIALGEASPKILIGRVSVGRFTIPFGLQWACVEGVHVFPPSNFVTHTGAQPD